MTNYQKRILTLLGEIYFKYNGRRASGTPELLEFAKNLPVEEILKQTEEA